MQMDTGSKAARRFLEPFRGKACSPPPIWLMRQAGRYLPEYRETRTKAGGFLNLCYTPELAAEVTLQPIRRYGFDAAILFSDILVVPDALGQKVSFVEGEGPRLEPIRNVNDLRRLDPARTARTFAPVWETVARLRQDLPRETALIGFCGRRGRWRPTWSRVRDRPTRRKRGCGLTGIVRAFPGSSTSWSRRRFPISTTK